MPPRAPLSSHRPHTPHTWEFGFPGFNKPQPPPPTPPLPQSPLLLTAEPPQRRPCTAPPARSDPNPLPTPPVSRNHVTVGTPAGTHRPVPDRSAESKLYLGGEAFLQSAEFYTLGATHRLDCEGAGTGTFAIAKGGDGVWVASCPMADDVAFCASPQRAAVLERAATFIDDALRAGGSVVLHCAHGVSASATLLLTYLLHRRMSLLDACTLLKAKRVNAAPTDRCVELLFELEERLFRIRSSREAVLAVLRRRWLEDVRAGKSRLASADRIL